MNINYFFRLSQKNTPNFIGGSVDKFSYGITKNYYILLKI